MTCANGRLDQLILRQVQPNLLCCLTTSRHTKALISPRTCVMLHGASHAGSHWPKTITCADMTSEDFHHFKQPLHRYFKLPVDMKLSSRPSVIRFSGWDVRQSCRSTLNLMDHTSSNFTFSIRFCPVLVSYRDCDFFLTFYSIGKEAVQMWAAWTYMTSSYVNFQLYKKIL